MDDLISRQAVIDALEKVSELYPWRVPGDRDSYSPYNEAWQDALNRADSEIEALSSAPQRTGHWIQYGDEFCCSECGGWAYMDECDEGIKTHQSKFCPECGARMKGE